VGPGAAILPPDVTKIHMDFALKGNVGHVGPKKFWRECLPRLKYYNPAVSMTVNRTTENTTDPVMTIHFNKNGTARTEQIDMRNIHSSHILSYLLDITKAKEVKPSEEDLKLGKELAEQQAKSAEDSRICLEINAERRRQAAIINQSRKQMEERKQAE